MSQRWFRPRVGPYVGFLAFESIDLKTDLSSESAENTFSLTLTQSFLSPPLLRCWSTFGLELQILNIVDVSSVLKFISCFSRKLVSLWKPWISQGRVRAVFLSHYCVHDSGLYFESPIVSRWKLWASQ